MANNIGPVAADASDAAKQETDRRNVAVTISLIGKVLKIFVYQIYPLRKHTISLQKFWKAITNPKYLKLQNPTESIIHFQSENETVTEYADKLKRLALNCNFGAYLTRPLRDQFFGGVGRGVKSQATKKLLSENRTFHCSRS